MPIERTKDVVIECAEHGKQSFQISRVTADVGIWIYSQRAKWGDREVFDTIRNYFFNPILWYKDVDGTPVPRKIFHNGAWIEKTMDLSYDIEAVNALYDAVLGFNFDDFFAKRLAEQAEARAKLEAAIRGTT